MGADNANGELLQILNLIATVPSIIGSLIMFYFCLRSISQNTSIKLILALAISDFFYSANNLMTVLNSPEDSVACKVEAFSKGLFLQLTIWIATSISILHYKLIAADPNFKRSRFVFICIMSGVVISLTLALRYFCQFFYVYLIFRPFYASDIFTVKKYGDACLIDIIYLDGDYIRYIDFGVFQGLFICGGFLITLFVYMLTITRTRRIQLQYFDSEDVHTSRLLLYPAILFAAILPPTISRILGFFGPSINLPSAFVMLITHSIGFLNALVYGCLRRIHDVPRDYKMSTTELGRRTLQSLNWNSVKEFIE